MAGVFYPSLSPAWRKEAETCVDKPVERKSNVHKVEETANVYTPLLLRNKTTVSFDSLVKMVRSSAAGRLIQKRATTGSLSSVFYLKSSGMKEAKTAENMFLVGIGIPMGALGLGGLWQSIKTGKW